MMWGRMMRAAWTGLAAALLCVPGRADVPVSLYKSFAGNVNFAGTAVTLRTGKNYCDVYSAKTVLGKTLAGIPSGSQVVAAYLYWAGSGSTADNQVIFDGKAISAQRKYTSRYTTGGVNYDYFSGVADVTAQVAAKGNATYSFSGLTVNTRNPYCSIEGVLGGFSVLVVYKNVSTEPFRVLNLYEGFQNMRYSSITLTVGNFKIPDPLGSATARVGHITWEGDLTLNQQGEDLAFNGTILTDAMNPAGNQFNSQSNINGDKASYGIDFDAYTITSPLIQPGQTSATTKYSSGQDMVLLNAEVVAVPNVPVADLGITMTRTGQPIAGGNVSYTLNVVNNGPNQETGPVTVTDTLPSGMSFAAVGGGADWTCTTSGQTATCTYNKAVPSGTSLPPVTVSATVLASGSGTYTNVAAVRGMVFDNVNANNSASDTSSSGPVFALTDKACTAGTPISTNLSDNNCHRVVLVSGAKQNVWVTSLDSKGVPDIVSTNNATVKLQMALTCVNPSTAGVVSGVKVQATFYTSNQTVTLPPCASPGGTLGWTQVAVSLAFPANSPSGLSPNLTPTQLYYPDVGVLQMSVYDGANIYAAGLVSQPARLGFVDIKSGALSNPGAGNPHPGFVPAGETFTVRVRAENAAPGNASIPYPPNFGNESPPAAITLQQDTPPAVQGTMGSPVAGIATGQLTYAEAGDIKLTPVMSTTLLDYMGSGVPVPGVPSVVGRFYPAYFTTAVTSNFDCQPSMACPSGKLSTGEDLGVSGAAYSGQAFAVEVTPRNKAGDPMTRYVGAVNLSPVDKPGPTGVPLASAAGTLTGGAIPAPPAPPAGGSTTYLAKPTFTLPKVFDPANSHAMGWSAPTTLYLRVEAQENVVTSTGTATVTVSSKAGGGVATPEEDGVRAVVGRTQVYPAFGSELVKLKVPVAAQYWSGTAWDSNLDDDSSGLAVSFSNCTGRLSTGTGANNCNLTLLKAPSAPSTVSSGAANVFLDPPGRGNTGTGMMSVFRADQPWLPSLAGKVVFGINKSPVIYIREVY